MANAVFIERADDRRIDLSRIARDPVETPETRLGIEEAQGEPFEKFALQSGKPGRGIRIHVGCAVEDLRIHVGGIELCPVVAIGQPLVQVPVVHFPFADQEIKVVRRGIRRSRYFEVTFDVEFHFGNRDAFIRGQLLVLSESGDRGEKEQKDRQAFHGWRLRMRT